MSRDEQIRRYGLEAQFWPDLGIEEPEGLELTFKFKIVKELPKPLLKKAKRLICWTFIDKKRFNKFQIIGFDELEGGRTTICPLEIFVTLNYMNHADQILVFDGALSYLLIRGKSASDLSFMLGLLYNEDFQMYESRATYGVILDSLKEEDLPPFDIEKCKKIVDKKLKMRKNERERRNLAEA